MVKSEFEANGASAVIMLFWLVTWFVNLVHFCNCNFETFGRIEIIKTTGIFVPLSSFVTVWY